MTEPSPLPTDRAPTIAEFVAALLPAQNRAEEVVIRMLRELERDVARLPEQEFFFWSSANLLYYAVLAFREHAGLPPITR